jgi:hypothetical protein
MTTAARTHSETSSHYYFKDGTPCFELPKADGKGVKIPTLADARKLNLLPSVTTILKILHKEALVSWRIEQACLAVLTTPRPAEESLDAFVHRVLHDERVQDQESQIARDRGTEIHKAMAILANGGKPDADILSWVQPAWGAVQEYGKTYETESILVGEGYAGTTDLIQEADNGSIVMWDFKSTKKLPKSEPWPEHRLQLAAYAQALGPKLLLGGAEITTKNCYISTIDCGVFVILDVPGWYEIYNEGFAPLVRHWQWAAGYCPNQ